MTNHTTIIIFGASGNLACTKLFPALYTLFRNGFLTNFSIIGAAAQALSAQELRTRIKPHINNYDEAVFTQFQKHYSYAPVNFTNSSDFEILQQHAQQEEVKHQTKNVNRLIYCSTAAHYFETITQQCARVGLLERTTSATPYWHRIVYEKPFGHDAQSAQAINHAIAQCIDEDQIYRVDHYLTKELVSNIALLRFTNCIVEPLWNNKYIENVQIILNEKSGVDGRGGYYDHYGALKDMVQNHILELVALIGMETPDKLIGDYITEQRARVLQQISVTDVLLGQYAGYLNEPDVAPESTTETFVELACTINNDRWCGVPFYIKTGKHLPAKETVIHIKFKQVECLLTKNCPSDSNYLTIQIYPEPSIAFIINAKKPGEANQVEQVRMEFPHHAVFGPGTPESYETIFKEIINGEHSISVRFDEIESAWRIVDAIKKMNKPVYSYEKNTNGPQELEHFEKKHEIRWRS